MWKQQFVFLPASVRDSVLASSRGSVPPLREALLVFLFFLAVPWLVLVLHLPVHAPHRLFTVFRLISHLLKALDHVLLHDSANQNRMYSSTLISAISNKRHEYHPTDRYIRSGSGAARSAALFCWSLRDDTLSRLRGTLSLTDRRRSDGGIGICNPLEKEYGCGRWLLRPQTHTYLERKRRQVGIVP